MMRELDDALRMSDLALDSLNYNRIERKTVHRTNGLFWKSVFERLARYAHVDDAPPVTHIQ